MMAPKADATSFYRELLQTVSTMIGDALGGQPGPQTATLWYVLDGGGAALPTTTFLEGVVDFPCVITGLTLLSRETGALVLDVGRATYDDYPTFTSICASAPPTLAAYKVQDNTLTGWTTQINGTDILAISVTTNAGGLTRVSLGLRVRKLGSR